MIMCFIYETKAPIYKFITNGVKRELTKNITFYPN